MSIRRCWRRRRCRYAIGAMLLIRRHYFHGYVTADAFRFDIYCFFAFFDAATLRYDAFLPLRFFCPPLFFFSLFFSAAITLRRRFADAGDAHAVTLSADFFTPPTLLLFAAFSPLRYADVTLFAGADIDAGC